MFLLESEESDGSKCRRRQSHRHHCVSVCNRVTWLWNFPAPAWTGHTLPREAKPSPAESTSQRSLCQLHPYCRRGAEAGSDSRLLAPSLPPFLLRVFGSQRCFLSPSLYSSTSLYVTLTQQDPTAPYRDIYSYRQRLALYLGLSDSSLYHFSTWPALDPRTAWGCVS